MKGGLELGGLLLERPELLAHALPAGLPARLGLGEGGQHRLLPRRQHLRSCPLTLRKMFGKIVLRSQFLKFSDHFGEK